MPTSIHRRVAAANDGTNPYVIARMTSGWLVAADGQVVDGYCLLLPDPVVPHLNALEPQARAHFLNDMAIAGDALLSITNAARINYEILGNLDPALHAHIIPRRDTEPEDLKTKPIWFHDFEIARPFSPEQDRWAERLRDAILRLTENYPHQTG